MVNLRQIECIRRGELRALEAIGVWLGEEVIPDVRPRVRINHFGIAIFEEETGVYFRFRELCSSRQTDLKRLYSLYGVKVSRTAKRLGACCNCVVVTGVRAHLHVQLRHHGPSQAAEAVIARQQRTGGNWWSVDTLQ
ncbi:MAG: hypothetical protein KDD69_05435 [Bdellovibrionales bacterium]|nr:hypothetical protein [Bdellovibrionales bacterium]